MKDKIKAFFIQGIKLILFLAGIFVILVLLNDIMIFKREDSTNPVHNYYDLPQDSVDVLIMGSSHAGMNISSKTLWNEYGIAGYRLWGATQPIWNSYYYLQEALKYQKPKVVLLDIYSISNVLDHAEYAIQVNNLMGLKYTPLRWDAVKASSTKDLWVDLFLGFPVYHSRYNELREKDFSYFPWQKHQEMQYLSSEEKYDVHSFTITGPDPDTEPLSIGEKNEQYFRMFLQTCKDNNLPLELVVCPYEIHDTEWRRYERAAEIAAEYGYTVTNYNENYADYGIDPENDFLDPGHFNHYGISKYTRAIAELLEKYNLPDRRLDANHVWNRVTEETFSPVLSLTEQMICDGKQDFKEFDLNLFDNPLASWSVFIDFDFPEYSEDKDEQAVLSSCVEIDSVRSGLKIWLDEKGELKIHLSTNLDIPVPVSEGTKNVRLAIIKTGQDIRLYKDGEEFDYIKLDFKALPQHESPLYLGCDMSEEGQHRHFAKTVIHDLQIYDDVPEPSFILNWAPADLPIKDVTPYVSEATESDIIVSLQNRFEGDGDTIVDTGVRLYEDPEYSWTLLAKIDPVVRTGDSVYFACFSEEEDHYRGLLVRKIDKTGLNVLYGQTLGLDLTIPEDSPSVLAIVKKRSEYTVYLNGEKVCEDSVTLSDPYDGDLLIGCEFDADGNVFRRSGTTVDNFVVYEGLLPEEDILAWDPEPLPPAPKKSGMDVSYTLRDPFTGNASDAFVDTGIKLFDNAAKDWTISFSMDQVDDIFGAVISCYDETPGDFHGLLVRKMEDNHLTFVTGLEYSDYYLPPTSTCSITIVKEGMQFRIYLDNELIAEKESRCPVYLGNLYIGCERDQYGNPMRFSNVRVRDFTIENRALTEEEVTGR